MHTRCAGRCPLAAARTARSCPRPLPCPRVPSSSALFGTGGGRRRRTPFAALSLLFFSRLCPASTCAVRGTRTPRPCPCAVPCPAAPSSPPCRAAARPPSYPPVRALRLCFSHARVEHLVVVDDGAEKGRRSSARRRPSLRHSLRSWTTPCALSCALCWPASSPRTCAPGLHTINIATARRPRIVHRRAVRSALGWAHDACSSLPPYMPPDTSTRPQLQRPPLLFFFCVALAANFINTPTPALSLCKPASASSKRQCRIPLHEWTGALRRWAARGSRRARCARSASSFDKPGSAGPHRRSSLGASFSTRSRRRTAASCLNTSAQPGRPDCTVSALV